MCVQEYEIFGINYSANVYRLEMGLKINSEMFTGLEDSRLETIDSIFPDRRRRQRF